MPRRSAWTVRDPRLAGHLSGLGVDVGLGPVPGVAGLRFPCQLPTGRGRGSPARLLWAEDEVVGFRGREQELLAAEAWCLEAPALVRLLTGAAGTGKTRLALELCARMANRGWLSAFIAEAATEDTIARVMQLEQPALLVVDCAETRLNLGQLLEPLASSSDGAAVRVLLLAREAGDWWTELRLARTQLRDLLKEGESDALGPVDEELLDRQAAFRQAASAFAAVQGIALGPVRVPDLRGPEYEAILHVQMAALDAVGTPEEPGSGPGARGQTPVLTAILDREARYWRRSAQARGLQYSLDVLKRVVAVSTLLAAEDKDEAMKVLVRVPVVSDASEQGRRDLACWYHDLYPGREPLTPLQPDSLAEELMGQVLEDMPALVEGVFSGLAPERERRALTILDRTVQRRPELERVLAAILRSDLVSLASSAITVAVQTGNPIGRVLAAILEPRPEAAIALCGFYGDVPDQTVSLRELACVLAAARVELARRTKASPDRLAESLNDLSIRLSRLGRREQALAAEGAAQELDLE